MTKKRDIELARRHTDHRQHRHGQPDHADCAPGCVPTDHHRCEAPGWEPVPVHYTAICRTPGCVNDGRSFEVDTFTNADGIDRVICGKCGEWIEDLA